MSNTFTILHNPLLNIDKLRMKANQKPARMGRMSTTSSKENNFDDFVAIARSSAHLWRLFLGTTCVLLCYVTGTFGMVALYPEILLRSQETPLNMAAILFSLSFVFMGLWIALKLFHKQRSFLSLATRPNGPLTRHFALAASVVSVSYFASFVFWSIFYDASPNNPLSTTLLWLPLFSVLILIQTGAEEFFFRGYLTQQLAARFSHPVVWIIVPQIFFTLAHFDPHLLGESLWPILATIFVSSLMLVDLTRITGNIGAAWGWHFVNNLTVFIIIVPPGHLDAVSFLHTPYSSENYPPFVLLQELTFSILSWFILRTLLRRL